MMKKSIQRRPYTISPTLQAAPLPPLLKRIYAARRVDAPELCTYSLSQLIPFTELLSSIPAAEALADAIAAQQRILVLGDFDADGATSTAVAVSALKAFGAKEVVYLVPNRFKYGYGLTPEIVEVAMRWQPDWIITVDNGIASHAGVAAAHAHQCRVLITDHHLPGTALPEASIIVNPNQPGCSFPSKTIAGVGVIFYVMLALRAALRERNWFVQQNIPEPNLARWLDLVALGTVADVVPLDSNNRILVHQGIQRIQRGLARPGIYALLKVAAREHTRLTADDLGFAVAPRLNAAGRLDDMSLGITCLLADDVVEAEKVAQTLDDLNRERRVIEDTMHQQALHALQAVHLSENGLPAGVCLYDASWHQGVIGIVASRIKDRYHRPVIAFAEISETEIKGSGRSIAGLHMRDILDEIATQHPELLSKFGGHAMAAGLSLKKSDLAKFAALFAEAVKKHLPSEVLEPLLLTDGELSREEFTVENAELLKSANPWGQGFPAPTFDGAFTIHQQRLVGEKHLKLMLTPVNYPNFYLDAIAFFIDLKRWPNHRCTTIRAVYRLDVNYYQGTKRLQLVIEHLETC